MLRSLRTLSLGALALAFVLTAAGGGAPRQPCVGYVSGDLVGNASPSDIYAALCSAQ